MTHHRSGDWYMEPAVIIGGGPSVSGRDLSCIPPNVHVVAINRAWELPIHKDAIVSIDRHFWPTAVERERWAEISTVPKYQIGYPPQCEGVNHIRSFEVDGVHEQWSRTLEAGLVAGSNSGIAALNFADVLRASPIYLLGFDMGATTTGTHQNWWHDGYGWRPQQADIYQRFAADFMRRAHLVSSQVYAIMPTRLDCFDALDWNEFEQRMTDAATLPAETTRHQQQAALASDDAGVAA